jgi:hypothetical protein
MRAIQSQGENIPQNSRHRRKGEIKEDEEREKVEKESSGK